MKITPVDKTVSEALILVCEKCGKKLATGDENPARALQLAMKEEIKATGRKGQIRAVSSSCLDVCPKDEIAIAIMGTNSHIKNGFFFTVKDASEKNATEILAKGLEMAKIK